ncbi:MULTISPECIES: hypothetical protein [unclassified Prochlorococcus]|uniref:hypothetical protein n=1 Tax=unclassified Prochlorococcus TaxID=2627481 RepID=UPI000533BAEB|nr:MULTISPECIES: hypothetical protein [unclassified Prochlorococcus]KGG28526.1 hypothetical protein EV12_0613 [Prochlorococcus sp. MIT 0701]KGG29840.1 hypothetical protein EV13_0874 [Prochlorococcus sp. MIT 0702]KGG36384.1 hypothetical protein EV14_0298 [Prochlorococcus sp. MIT 0703]
MTGFNTDYNNTELLDQELTTAELTRFSGGMLSEFHNMSEDRRLEISQYPKEAWDAAKRVDSWRGLGREFGFFEGQQVQLGPLTLTF